MTRLRRIVALVVLSAPLVTVAGCKQGLHDRCQTQDDCDGSLTCVLPAGGTAQAGGTCENGTVSSDMAVGSDASPARD